MKNKWWELPAVSLLLLALAIISTYPLIRYFDIGIPYAPFGEALALNRSGDQMQLHYWFWLVKENFMGTVPFDSNPFEFNMLTPHESSGLNTVPLAFLYMLFSPLGDVVAYNSTIFTTYLLAGVFMYLLVRLYSDSRAGALLAAVIFTFAPSRIIGIAAGHGYGMLFFTYPFILYFMEKGIRSRKIRYGVIAGIGLKALSMLEPHLIYYLCVFLGIYIPVRVLALFPRYEAGGPFLSSGKRLFSWPEGRSLLLMWGAGVSAVVYSRFFVTCGDGTHFFTPVFWWIITLYPLVPMLAGLCFAAIYLRLSPLGFREGLAVEAGSLLPLFLFLPLSILACYGPSVDTGVVVAASLVAVSGTKVWLLRSVLFPMFRVAGKGIWRRRRSIYPILPVILTMGHIVYWIVGTKVEKIQSTIAGGGRTLGDVGLFSAHLSDLFSSMSTVYIGIVPAVCGAGVLVVLIGSAVFARKQDTFGTESELIRLFYMSVAFCCLLLALGLAFGKSSLYILFYQYFPFFNYPRVSDRIITLVLFALAIVVGFVVGSIQQRCHRKRCLLTVNLLVLVAVGLQLKDYNLFKPMGVNVLDRGQDIYTYVKKNIGDGLLLEVPLWPGDSHQSSLYQHYIMLDRVRRVNGCSPVVLTEYIDSVFWPLADINQGKLDREQYELLQQMGVKFITVHDRVDVFPPKVSRFGPLTTVRRLKNSPYLEFVDIQNMMYSKKGKGRWQDLYLFRVKDGVSDGDDLSSLWYTMPSFYDVNNRLYHQTGKIAKDTATGRTVLQADDGDKPGFLVYGPYVIHPAGRYRCTFTVHAGGTGEKNVARLEVVETKRSGDIRVLGQREVRGNETAEGYQKIPLEFSLEENTKLEFRVFYYGNGPVRVERVVVTQEGHDAPIYSLEAEKMVGAVGQLEFVDDASGGKVIESVRGRKKGDMVYGPNRLYPSGSYRARFSLRLKEPVRASGVAAVVSVTDARNMSVYQQRQIKIAELNSKEFTEIGLDYVLNRDDELSFHVRFTGKQSIQLDRIEIQRTSSLPAIPFLLDE